LARKSLALVLVVAVALIAVGCGTSAPVKLSGLPEASQLMKGHEQPLRYKVALAPISTPKRPKPKGQFSAAVNTDITAMRNQLVQTLREFKVFSEVETVGGGNESESIQLAREKGADLLLTSSLVRYDVTYESGVRGAGNVILWLFSPWATWFVADEVYTADIGLQMALKKISDGSVLWQQTVDGKAKRELDDLQRVGRGDGLFLQQPPELVDQIRDVFSRRGDEHQGALAVVADERLGLDEAPAG